MASDWLFTAEGLAATLELVPGGPQGMNETARADFVSHQLGGLQRSPSHIQDPTYAEYAAKYMPQTIQKWRESQYVMAAAPLLLNELSHTPYFMRLALIPENQDLVVMQVRRTLADADTIQTLESEEVIRTLQFLSTLLLVQGTDNIPVEDKAALVVRLQVWKRRFSHILAGEIAERCLGIINEDIFMLPMIMGVRTALLKGVQTCAAERCSRREGSDGGPLLRCARCRATVYCSQAHQKAHWRQHKPECFKVDY